MATGFDPVALLAAVALPGAGHVVGGDLRRGLHVGGGVLGLFFGGILIGGISVVDRYENDWWFYGQALVGPAAFAVDYVHQNTLKTDRGTTGRPLTPPPGVSKYQRSIGKPLDVGILFTAIAGMLNAIAIIDAGFPTRRRKGIMG